MENKTKCQPMTMAIPENSTSKIVPFLNEIFVFTVL